VSFGIPHVITVGFPSSTSALPTATASLAGSRAQCVSSSRSRALTIRERPAYEAAVSARQRQTTEAFKQSYARRAGIEGTLSQGGRIGDLRRTRYIGLPKTRLLHLLIATALNMVRIAAWLTEAPLAQTRTPPFVALGKAAACY